MIQSLHHYERDVTTLKSAFHTFYFYHLIIYQCGTNLIESVIAV